MVCGLFYVDIKNFRVVRNEVFKIKILLLKKFLSLCFSKRNFLEFIFFFDGNVFLVKVILEMV